MIPPRLVRTVPEHTTDEVEAWWAHACSLHPGWEHVTWRDPIDPAEFPWTSPVWDRCTSGAQRAGLIRLEDLWRHGGIYLDSDVELYRPLTPLTCLAAFAAWEDPRVVPDAVLGCQPGHPAWETMVGLARRRLKRGAWASGPGVTTDTLPNRPDVLLLPPSSFYPVHYTAKDKLVGHRPDPWTFGIHHWHASWLR